MAVAIGAYRRIVVAIAADGQGNCCDSKSEEIAVAIAADIRGNELVSEDCRGNGRGWPRMAVGVVMV